MSNIRNTSVLYRPSLSVWLGRKKDKAASLKATEEAGAVDGAANVNKALLPDCPELIAINKWAGGFRTWIYSKTLPWDDSGWRIARVENHLEFMAEAAQRVQKWMDLVEEFIAAYPMRKAEASFKLNHLFNDADYPSVDELRASFKFTIHSDVVPDSEDFRILESVPPEEVERLVTEGQRAMADKFAGAMDELYARLNTVVSTMASTLSKFDNKEIKKFNDTLVGNIESLVNAIPALNVTNDPRLDALAKKAKGLTDYAPEDLRKDSAVRSAAIAEARALAAEMVAAFEGEFVANSPTKVEAVLTKIAEQPDAEEFAPAVQPAPVADELASLQGIEWE